MTSLSKRRTPVLSSTRRIVIFRLVVMFSMKTLPFLGMTVGHVACSRPISRALEVKGAAISRPHRLGLLNVEGQRNGLGHRVTRRVDQDGLRSRGQVGLAHLRPSSTAAGQEPG